MVKIFPLFVNILASSSFPLLDDDKGSDDEPSPEKGPSLRKDVIIINPKIAPSRLFNNRTGPASGTDEQPSQKSGTVSSFLIDMTPAKYLLRSI
jgi:hypothetical protein